MRLVVRCAKVEFFLNSYRSHFETEDTSEKTKITSLYITTEKNTFVPGQTYSVEVK